MRKPSCVKYDPSCESVPNNAPLPLQPSFHSNKVDVWSIGVIYYQMLFGRRPFGDGQSQDHILRNQTMLHATEVHFPSKPSITDDGKSFIRDCLTYDQMDRPSIGQLCVHSYLKLATL